MDFLTSKAEELPGQLEVQEIGKVATAALDGFISATALSFKMLWDDPSGRQDRLNRMATRAALGFEQHHDAVTFLLRSCARALRGTVEINDDDFTALISNAPLWLMTHLEHPMTAAIFKKMPPETFTPPQSYTVNNDGTITLN